MEWSKLKNIILIILALTNAFLLFFVLRREVGEHQTQQQARTNAVAFLAERNVRVEEELVPRTASLLPRTVERDLTAESAVAAKLLGETVTVESRGGEVYRYYNDNGAIQFHSDGAFSAEFKAGAFPLEGDAAAACRELLARLDFQGELLEEGEDTLVFRQQWEDCPLFTQQVTLVREDGCVVAMTGGRRLVGEPVQVSGRSPITEASALIRFLSELDELGDVCSRIEAITQGYVSTTSLSGPMVLNPVWRITTDTGIYQMDLLTGELTRVMQ